MERGLTRAPTELPSRMACHGPVHQRQAMESDYRATPTP
jgi:hypothetical protein